MIDIVLTQIVIMEDHIHVIMKVDNKRCCQDRLGSDYKTINKNTFKKDLMSLEPNTIYDFVLL